MVPHRILSILSGFSRIFCLPYTIHKHFCFHIWILKKSLQIVFQNLSNFVEQVIIFKKYYLSLLSFYFWGVFLHGLTDSTQNWHARNVSRFQNVENHFSGDRLVTSGNPNVALMKLKRNKTCGKITVCPREYVNFPHHTQWFQFCEIS